MSCKSVSPITIYSTLTDSELTSLRASAWSEWRVAKVNRLHVSEIKRLAHVFDRLTFETYMRKLNRDIKAGKVAKFDSRGRRINDDGSLWQP